MAQLKTYYCSISKTLRALKLNTGTILRTENSMKRCIRASIAAVLAYKTCLKKVHF